MHQIVIGLAAADFKHCMVLTRALGREQADATVKARVKWNTHMFVWILPRHTHKHAQTCTYTDMRSHTFTHSGTCEKYPMKHSFCLVPLECCTVLA